MSKRNKSKSDRAELVRRVQAGLQEYFGSATLMLANASYTPNGLQALLQDDIDVGDESTKARAAWLQAAALGKTTRARTDAVLRAIHAQVIAAYGDAEDVGTILAAFGYAPRKKVVLTAEQRATKVAKLRATRKARGTLGPKAKAKIKGVIPPEDA